ncbi:hypothetical protein IAQ61_007616 [Plenodomus lingam]|uniref:uncharacterized protein n=1 Tax=Leptosphaeria maculans TaxID=5022 RepID=UPI003320241E|nr:hypothetical protein IAQ61_007616 [Plenodomus lingam]
MQRTPEPSPSKPRKSLVYEVTQIAQLYPELTGLASESPQDPLATTHDLAASVGAVHDHQYYSNNGRRRSESITEWILQTSLHSQQQTFAVASASTLGSSVHSLITDHSADGQTDQSLSEENSDFAEGYSYAQSITSLMNRYKNHGAFCRLKTTFKRFLNFSRRSKAPKRASTIKYPDDNSTHLRPFGVYQNCVSNRALAAISSDESPFTTNQLLPQSTFHTPRPLPTPPAQAQAAQSYISASDPDDQTPSSSRRSSFTRNLHTALLYATHTAPSSASSPPSSAPSEQAYPVLESSSAPEHTIVPTYDGDFSWMQQHIISASPSGSPASLAVPRVRSVGRKQDGQSSQALEEDASDAWITVSRASADTVSIRRGGLIRSWLRGLR